MLRSRSLHRICFALVCGSVMGTAQAQSARPEAGRDGGFHVDVAGVIGRSDIVLGRANTEAGEAMPVGNGRLGVAVWSADGLTAQLNRNDTLPDRLSPGQVVIPGLAALTAATDYSGRLDLYNGEIREQGGGVQASIYVQPETDTLVVDVRGTNPDKPQTAQLRLWAPRTTHAAVDGAVGLLSQFWVDNTRPGASDRHFGS